MGVATTLTGINLTPSEDNNEALYGNDAMGSLALCREKAQELVNSLTTLANYLPIGDPNIATIQTIITNLS